MKSKKPEPKRTARRKPKRTARRKTNLLSVQLQELEQRLINAKCTTDKKCKNAVWEWLSDHGMYNFYLNETRKKSADAIFDEVFLQVTAFCQLKGFCKKSPLTCTKFIDEWKKAIRKFEKEAKKPAYLCEF